VNVELSGEELSQLIFELGEGIKRRHAQLLHTSTTGDTKRILKLTIERYTELKKRLQLCKTCMLINEEEKKL